MRQKARTVRDALRHACLHWLVLTWRPFIRHLHDEWPVLVMGRAHRHEIRQARQREICLERERDHYKNLVDREQENLTNALNHIVRVSLEIRHRPPTLLRMLVTIPQELFLTAPDVHAHDLARHVGYAVEKQIMTADLTRLDDYRAAWDRQTTRWQYQPYPPESPEKYEVTP